MAENTQVTLAWPLERDGVNHKAGSTIPLPDHEAAALVRSGLARTPDSAPAAEPTPDAVAPAAATPAPKGK